jgi:precorrin-8X/cobalt-precorrin-8 methylmutase
MKPQAIESLSFSIIDSEAGDHGFAAEQWPIVRRMIHTSADFEYIRSVQFHPDAVACGIKAILKGRPIITDTNMAKTGIRERDIRRYGGAVHCFIADPDVAQRALDEQITRAQAAMDKAADRFKGGIYALGNAPTALFRLLELIENGTVMPDLVIGFPVGFVNAAESKQALMMQEIPHISNIGRKGGSNIVASVVNALAIMAGELN